MHRVAVMGDSDSVQGFRALGLDVYEVEDAQEGRKLLRRLDDGEYAVIFMTERLFALLEPEVDQYAQEAVPAIIPIPGVSGNTGIGARNVSKSVERAVGSDIIN